MLIKMLVRIGLTVFLFASVLVNFATCRMGGYCDPCLVPPDGFVLASNHFGLNLYRALSGENARKSDNDKENLFLSPFSVATAMAMVNQGAEGETAKQLESTLGFELARINRDKAATGAEIQGANREIFNQANESYVLRSANVLVVDQNSAVKESYKSGIQTLFGGEVISGDFATNGKEMMDRVNQWCSAKTNGKIEKIISNPPTPPLALLNAVYFKGSWMTKFNASFTKPAPFYQGDTTYRGVRYMFDEGKYRLTFLEELNASLVELPYQGGNVSLYALLPEKRADDLSHLRHALNPWYIESAIKHMFTRDVKLTFPRFKFSSKYDLKPTLKQMGIDDAFGGKANFRSITDNSIAISEVKHVAVIEVNEEGSEAAAVTYTGFVTLSLPPPPEELTFDHPFIFFLRHKPTKQLLFIGEINKLTAEMSN